jgi:hypothetical protein
MAFGLDWSAPWLAPYRTIGQELSERCRFEPVHQALNRVNCGLENRAPVRFVCQSERPVDMPYEQFIHVNACVPTRDNAHDLLNGLCWLSAPRLKLRLNQLQALELATQAETRGRGPVRDALTLMDENAAWLRAPQPLWKALEAKNWPQVWTLWRAHPHETDVWIMGHALLEKLIHPRKSMTAHVLWLSAQPGSSQDLAAIDARCAQALDPAWLASKPFAHLPVLGVPGWWPANQDPAFYADPEVFRPPRLKAPKTLNRHGL